MREHSRTLGAVLRAVVFTSAIFMQVYVADAQTSSTGYVPSPSPGYGLYYHDSQVNPNATTRWGYHDGWEDGRRDRVQGAKSEDTTKKNRYVSPPEHGGHLGSTREEYLRQFRAAYLHGYEHGSRL